MDASASTDTEFTCLLCRGTTFQIWKQNCPDYYLKSGKSVQYVKCNSCALVQQFPLPNDIPSLYKDYPIHIERSGLARIARDIFHAQVYFKPKSESGQDRLLDFGCGDGTYLRKIKPHFKEVCGFEPSETHAALLSNKLGCRIYSQQEKLVQDNAASFDTITAHFVLEHLSDLHATFSLLSKLLKPHGVLHVSVPAIHSWEARLFGRFWHGLDAPRHLVFPDTTHFDQLAHQYGFCAPHHSKASFPNTLAGSISSVLFGRVYAPVLQSLILPCSFVTMLFPQGSLIITMKKNDV